jgi:multiple sugar transport system substrate-binding protein
MVWLTDRTQRGALIGACALTLALVAPAVAQDASPAASPAAGDSGPIALSIASNAIVGGKNDAEAAWIQDYVIPTFEQMMADEGKDVTVTFQGRGVDDENYKAQLALDLGAGTGDDVIAIDGIWVGEFAQAGFITPLDDILQTGVDDWDGWGQIPEAVQGLMSFEGARYGVPAGTDGRILYYRKDLFEQAGLPTDWQPTSWQDILDASEQLKAALPDVNPLQINAGVSMGEATTMQGILPLLVGTGKRIYDEDTGLWLGDTPELEAMLQYYADIYQTDQVGDADLQLRQDGRDRSFQDFAEGRIGILLEGDYLWRGVINPDTGTAPIADRDSIVGWAKIPAEQPGAGINGQDFVSMSGGGGRVLNPNTEHPAEAWALMEFMNSHDAVLDQVQNAARITQRQDVNDETLAGDPLLSFVSQEVLPITATRPGLAVYPQVSQLLQKAAEDAASGVSVADAAQAYQSSLEELVGADNVASGG